MDWLWYEEMVNEGIKIRNLLINLDDYDYEYNEDDLVFLGLITH
jgi:hypothetical protein